MSEDIWGKPPPGYVPGKGRGATGFVAGVSRKDAYAPQRAPKGAVCALEDGAPLGEALAAELQRLAHRSPETAAANAFFAAGAEQRRRRPRERAPARGADAERRLDIGNVGRLFTSEETDLQNLSAADWAGLENPAEGKKRRKEERLFPLLNSEVRQQLRRRLEDNFAGSIDPQAFDGALAADVGFFGANFAAEPSTANAGAGAPQTLEAPSAAPKAQQQEKLLRYLLHSESSNADCWLSLVRLARTRGQLSKARKLAATACAKLPAAPALWLEAAALFPPEQTADWLQSGLKHCGKSEALWLALAEHLRSAAGREAFDEAARSRLLARATASAPQCAALWQLRADAAGGALRALVLQSALLELPRELPLWERFLAALAPREVRKWLNAALSLFPAQLSFWDRALRESADAPERCAKIFRLMAAHADLDVLAFARAAAQGALALDETLWLRAFEAFAPRGAARCSRAAAQSALEFLLQRGFARAAARLLQLLLAADALAERDFCALLDVAPAAQLEPLAAALDAPPLRGACAAARLNAALLQQRPGSELFWACLFDALLRGDFEPELRGDFEAAVAALLPRAPAAVESLFAEFLLCARDAALARGLLDVFARADRAPTAPLRFAAFFVTLPVGEAAAQTDAWLRAQLAADVDKAQLASVAVPFLQLCAAQPELQVAAEALVQTLTARGALCAAGCVAALRLHVARKQFLKAFALHHTFLLSHPDAAEIRLAGVVAKLADEAAARASSSAVRLASARHGPLADYFCVVFAPREEKVAVAFDALERCGAELYACLAAARAFMDVRKWSSAREWLAKAAERAPRNADVPAHAQQLLELQLGYWRARKDAARAALLEQKLADNAATLSRSLWPEAFLWPVRCSHFGDFAARLRYFRSVAFFAAA